MSDDNDMTRLQARWFNGRSPLRNEAGDGGEDEKIGAFSWKRWGLGSLLLIGMLTAASLALLTRWFTTHSRDVLIASLFLLFCSGLLVLVKVKERIEPVRRRGVNMMGSGGVVVSEITPASPGVVRVGSETWSARSHETLKENQKVIVVRKEGLFVWVEREPLSP